MNDLLQFGVHIEREDETYEYGRLTAQPREETYSRLPKKYRGGMPTRGPRVFREKVPKGDPEYPWRFRSGSLVPGDEDNKSPSTMEFHVARWQNLFSEAVLAIVNQPILSNPNRKLCRASVGWIPDER